MSKRMALIVLAWLVLFGGGSALAAPLVVNQTPTSTLHGRTSQFFTDTGHFGFNVFEDFTLAQSTAITEVGWSGFYFNVIDLAANPPTADAEFFGVQFFSDNGGAPDGLLASHFFNPAGAGETFTGNQPFSSFSVPVFTYDATLGDAFIAEQGVTYWIRIFAYQHSPTATDPQWAWVESADGNHLSLQYDDLTLVDNHAPDRVLQLGGEPVPEPATVTLVGVGLLTTRLFRRRRS